jgi:hypothetical protein
MIIYFEITYGRYLNNIAKMFREANEKHEVAIPRQSTLEHVIEIKDEMNETSSERKGKINTVDVNDKLKLNKIEKKNVILINDDD